MRSWCALLFVVLIAPSQRIAQTQAPFVELVLFTPEPERFDAALDEVELRWQSAGLAAREAVQSPRAAVDRRTNAGVIFRVQDTRTLDDMATALRELEARNPEAQGHLVLYEANRPRTEATRRLLGRDVALMLVDNRDPVGVLRAFPTASVRPVESVPLSYVVEAADPLEALRIAGAIRNAPGVRAAYPLLRRTYATR